MEALLMKELLQLLKDNLPDTALFTEIVRQGYQTPAVLVELEKCSVRREMNNRFRAEGVFSLRADPGNHDALAAADLLDHLERIFRGKSGFQFHDSKVRPDGVAEASVIVCAFGFATGESPVMMGKMSYSLSLGPTRKDD